MSPRPAWAVLNYAKTGKRGELGTKIGEKQNRRWYRSLDPCAGNIVKDVTACDEFPYFSSRQGSGFSSPQPSIRPINAQQNRTEGTMLTKMIRRCEFESSGPITRTSNGAGGTSYLVLPTPRPGGSDVPSPFWTPLEVASPFTFGLCNGSNGGGGGAS